MWHSQDAHCALCVIQINRSRRGLFGDLLGARQQRNVDVAVGVDGFDGGVQNLATHDNKNEPRQCGTHSRKCE